VVKDIYNNKGQLIKSFTPELISSAQFKNEKTLKFIREGLFQVVNNPKGTAFARRGKGIMMAGKTGTSQVIRASADKVYQKCESMDYDFRHHGLFVAFAPADNPRIAAAALVEHGCHGSSAAAPVVESIVSTYMKKYQPESYLKNLDLDKEIQTEYYNLLKSQATKKVAPTVLPTPTTDEVDE
jgi:penicillin-binding protein 2